MPQKILHLGAGKMMIQNVKILKKSGYEVYLADENPDAPAFQHADGFSPVNISSPELVAEYAKKIGANAIIAVNDAGVYAAAFAAQKLDLKYHTVETALKCTDKGYMREAWKKKNLSQPAFMVVDSEHAIKDAIAVIGFPCILKPCLNWGSRGVSAIYKEEDIDWAIRFAYSNRRNSRFIVEEFIAGTEATIEGLVAHGKPSILAVSDKEHQDHPKYKVAMALNYPGNFSPKQYAILTKLIHDAIEALGITDGAFHAECMMQKDKVFLVEMAGRPGGGHIFSYIVEAVSGINMPVTLAKIYLNEEVSIEPEYQHGACYKFFNPPKGMFNEIQNMEQAQRSDGILDLGFFLKKGTVVGEIAGDADRPGHIVASGNSREEAILHANKALSMLKFS